MLSLNGIIGGATNKVSGIMGSVTGTVGNTTNGIISSAVGSATGTVSKALGSLSGGLDSGLLSAASRKYGKNVSAMLVSAPTVLKYQTKAQLEKSIVLAGTKQPATTVSAETIGSLTNSGMLNVDTSSLTTTSVKDISVGNGIGVNSLDTTNSNGVSVTNDSSNSVLSSLYQENLGIDEYSEFPFDIVQNIQYSYEQAVTEHPVEDGYVISDNITNKPLKIEMTAGVSTSPITWYYKNGTGTQRITDAIAALRTIRDTKEPITLIRPSEVFTDLVLTSFNYGKQEKSMNVVMFNLSFIKIVRVKLEMIDIPEDVVDKKEQDAAGGSGANGGEALNSGGTDTKKGAKGRGRTFLRGVYEGAAKMIGGHASELSGAYSSGKSDAESMVGGE